MRICIVDGEEHEAIEYEVCRNRTKTETLKYLNIESPDVGQI